MNTDNLTGVPAAMLTLIFELQMMHNDHASWADRLNKRVSQSNYGIPNKDWLSESYEWNNIRGFYEQILIKAENLKKLIDDNEQVFLLLSLSMRESQLQWLQTAKKYLSEIE